jgi:hypothetical protein
LRHATDIHSYISSGRLTDIYTYLRTTAARVDSRS